MREELARVHSLLQKQEEEGSTQDQDTKKILTYVSKTGFKVHLKRGFKALGFFYH